MSDLSASTPGSSEPARRLRISTRLVVVIAAIFVATKLVLLGIAARVGFFVMDEFQQGGYARYIDEGFYRSLWPFKTVLYSYYFRIGHLLGEGATEILLLARTQGFFLGVGIAALVYGLARRMSRSRAVSLLAVCTLLAFSTFMERVYRLRAEPVATVFGLASLLVAAREDRTWKRVAVAGVLAGAAFLCTQKAVYMNLALGLGLVVDCLSRRKVRDGIVQGAVLLAGWVGAVFAYSLFFGGAEFGKILRHLFLTPASFAVHGRALYPNINEFLGQTLGRNWIVYGLCVLGWLLLLRRWTRASSAERLVWVFTGVITASVFAHSQPWPYIFVMALPTVALWSGELVREVGQRWNQAGLATVAILLLFSIGFARNISFLQYRNEVQLEVVGHAESLLAPSDVYMDGIGMVVTRKIAGYSWWDAPHVQAIQQDPAQLDPIFAESPKVWILSYRTSTLSQQLLPRLQGSYLPVYPNVLLAGTLLPVGETVEMSVPWPGDYRLFDLEGKLVDLEVEVEGELISGRVELEKRTYSLRVPGATTTLCILPADTQGPLAIPPIPVQRELFHYVYRI